MENTVENLSAFFTTQALARRLTTKIAEGPTVSQRVENALSQAGNAASKFPDQASKWLNSTEGALGGWTPSVRHGLAGAGIGGLGALIISKLMGRKWKDSLWDSLLGAGVGGLGAGAYKFLSDNTAKKLPNVSPTQADFVGRTPTLLITEDGKKYKIWTGPDGERIPNQYDEVPMGAELAPGAKMYTDPQGPIQEQITSPLTYADKVFGEGAPTILGGGMAGGLGIGGGLELNALRRRSGKAMNDVGGIFKKLHRDRVLNEVPLDTVELRAAGRGAKLLDGPKGFFNKIKTMNRARAYAKGNAKPLAKMIANSTYVSPTTRNQAESFLGSDDIKSMAKDRYGANVEPGKSTNAMPEGMRSRPILRGAIGAGIGSLGGIISNYLNVGNSNDNQFNRTYGTEIPNFDQTGKLLGRPGG